MNLNDVFPDGLTGEGIFYALNEYNVPWKTSISSLSLDLEYYGNVSGGKTISPLLRRLLVDDVIPQSAINKLANSLYSMNGLRWTKLWNTYELEYNPIQNYNMTEVMSDDDTVTTYGRTHSKTGTEVDDRTRTDDNKESVYGFNSSTASDSDESDRTINDDNTHTYNVSDTDTGSDRQSHSYELTRSGNIGVTTSQQMIESERTLWMWRYFYDVVFPDIDKMLTISVYSDDIIPVTMSGGITPTGEISITLNGVYDVTEYASAAVNVPNTYTAADDGMVVHNGELVSQIGREISENGTYDTTLNNAVMVDVSNTYTAADEGKVVDNGALVAQSSQSITENGTYDTTLISELIANISSGVNILSGTDVPAAGVGENGSIYLQTTPAGVKNGIGQYIDTEYNGNANSKYVIDFRFDKTQASGWACPFGARPDPNAVSSASMLSLAIGNNNFSQSSVQWGSDGIIATGWDGATGLKGKFIHAEVSAGLAKMSVDGTQLADKTWTPTAVTNTTHIGLFDALANNQYQSWSAMDEMILYRFQIYENDILVHDFVPAVDGDNVVCVKDNVTGNYKYVNSGTLVSVSESDNIIMAYCKVNGTWQNIIGTDIDDVNTGI